MAGNELEGGVNTFIANPDYRDRLYSNLASSGAQPQLAGFPDGHPAWGIQPWFSFANCELKITPMSSCYSKKTAQDYGEAMYRDSVKQKIAKWFVVF